LAGWETAAVCAGFFALAGLAPALDLAAARPGLSCDPVLAGFAAVTGPSLDFAAVPRGNWVTAFAGTSRVSDFKLAV